MADERAATTEVAIVGAGLAGCLLACFLARRGLPVTLYERRPDPRVGQVERGRSINLALSERGLDALRRIGLVDQVMADALPMRGRMIHPVAGPLDFQAYSADGDRAINSISRGALNNALLAAAAELPGVPVRLRAPAGRAGPGRPGRCVRDAAGDGVAAADVVLGADGAGSRGARAAACRRACLTETSDFLDYGYKELTIPAAARRVRAGPGRAAHLAARHVDDDRPAEPGPLLHLHPVLAAAGAALRRR